MGLSHITVIAAISLSGLVPSSCSKQPPPSAQNKKLVVTNSIVMNRTNVVATNADALASKIRDLGIVQLTNHYETDIDLGKGRSCAIVPRLMDRRTVELTMTFGSRDANGKPTGMSVMRATVQPNKPFEMSVNDEDMTFTPKVAD